jgi:SAM-dependent methyltransferase
MDGSMLTVGLFGVDEDAEMPMIIPYRLLYAIGLTPWDGKGDATPLLRRVADLTTGSALDLGCGSGTHALLLAEHGWHVTGVDAVPQALRAARERASRAGDAGERVTFVQGDVTRLERTLGDQRFDLVYDIGCFHGLNERKRQEYLAGLDAYTKVGATLLIQSVVTRSGWGPQGVDDADMRRYAGERWRLDDVGSDSAGKPPAQGRSWSFRWYRMMRIE